MNVLHLYRRKFCDGHNILVIHCHPLLKCDPNFKSLAHREVSLKSITKFRPDRQTRKRVNKNMVKCGTSRENDNLFIISEKKSKKNKFF